MLAQHVSALSSFQHVKVWLAAHSCFVQHSANAMAGVTNKLHDAARSPQNYLFLLYKYYVQDQSIPKVFTLMLETESLEALSTSNQTRCLLDTPRERSMYDTNHYLPW